VRLVRVRVRVGMRVRVRVRVCLCLHPSMSLSIYVSISVFVDPNKDLTADIRGLCKMMPPIATFRNEPFKKCRYITDHFITKKYNGSKAPTLIIFKRSAR
jgi:hypothetical protein